MDIPGSVISVNSTLSQISLSALCCIPEQQGGHSADKRGIVWIPVGLGAAGWGHEIQFVSKVYIYHLIYFSVSCCCHEFISGVVFSFICLWWIEKRKPCSVLMIFTYVGFFLSQFEASEADFQSPSFPAVLIAWPTYYCDAVIASHDCLQHAASLWYSVIKCFFSPKAPNSNKILSLLSQSHVYKWTVVATNWSQSRQHSLYVLFPFYLAFLWVQSPTVECSSFIQ